MNAFARFPLFVVVIYLAEAAIAFGQTPMVTVTNVVAAVSEPNGVAEFLIVKDSGPNITVNFELLGTALSGADYVVVGGATSIVVPGNANIATVRIQVLDNFLIDADRTVTLRLLPGVGYNLGAPASATMIIQSDDPSPFPPDPFDWYLELRPTPLVGLNPPLVAPNSPLTIRFYATGPSAAIFLDSVLIGALKPTYGYGGPYFSPTLTNLSPGLHQFTAVVNRTNDPSQIGTLPLRVADALLQPANQGTISNTTVVNTAGLFTRSDNDPESSGAYIEFPVPPGATNWKSALFMTASPGGSHRLSVYQGDGVVTTNDVAADAELVTTFTPYAGNPQLQFDVTHWTQIKAGGFIGFKLQVDPTKQPTVGGAFNNPVLGFFSESNDVPAHITWLNFPTNAGPVADQPFVINLELYDPDSRITGVRVSEASSASYGSTARSILAERALDFPPGTNFISLEFTNISPGAHIFEIQVSTESGAITYFYPITFLTDQTNLPVHRWLGSDGETKSFYVVDAAGRAWVWGDNTSGQLGLGFRGNPITRPVALPPPAGKKWRQFTSDSFCAVGLTDDGAIYGMGTNNGGASIFRTANPNVPVALPMGESMSARQVGLTENSLWIINEQSHGVQLFPRLLGQSTYVDLATGGYHVLGVDSDGRMFDRSTDLGGVGGGGSYYVSLATLPWKGISTYGAHSAAIDATGKLFAWGPNIPGALPFFSTTNLTRPELAGFPKGVTAWTQVAMGTNVSLVVDQNGRLFSWGRRGYTGSAEPYVQSMLVPVHVPDDETGWLDVAVGSTFAMALSARGNLYVWGDIPASPAARHVDFPELVSGLPDLLSASATAEAIVTIEPTSIRLSPQFEADVIAPAGSNLSVETSTDLVNWVTLTNIANAGPKTRITAPVTAEGNLFIRVR